MSYDLMSNSVTAITERLNALYIEYINDFLTVEKFAAYHGTPVEEMQKLVDLGRHINHNELWKTNERLEWLQENLGK